MFGALGWTDVALRIAICRAATLGKVYRLREVLSGHLEARTVAATSGAARARTSPRAVTGAEIVEWASRLLVRFQLGRFGHAAPTGVRKGGVMRRDRTGVRGGSADQTSISTHKDDVREAGAQADAITHLHLEAPQVDPAR